MRTPERRRTAPPRAQRAYPATGPIACWHDDAVFGRVLTAMVTPIPPEAAVDDDGADRLADHLVDHGHDGIVVNGTTGESPTHSDDESRSLARSRPSATVPGSSPGVGSNDTAHSVEMAGGPRRRRRWAAGRHAVLQQAAQAGLVAHFRAVADATDLPVMLYDIPGRTGIPIKPETLVRLAEHPRIVAVKDAKGDLWAATQVMAATDLLWFSGDDELNLPAARERCHRHRQRRRARRGRPATPRWSGAVDGRRPADGAQGPPAAGAGRRRDHDTLPGSDHGQGSARELGRHRRRPRCACRCVEASPPRRAAALRDGLTDGQEPD